MSHAGHFERFDDSPGLSTSFSYSPQPLMLDDESSSSSSALTEGPGRKRTLKNKVCPPSHELRACHVLISVFHPQPSGRSGGHPYERSDESAPTRKTWTIKHQNAVLAAMSKLSIGTVAAARSRAGEIHDRIVKDNDQWPKKL